MLIKIQNIEEDCAELEEEVDDLKRRITKMLIDEKEEKVRDSADHEEQIEYLSGENVKFMVDLKKILTTFEQRKEED